MMVLALIALAVLTTPIHPKSTLTPTAPDSGVMLDLTVSAGEVIHTYSIGTGRAVVLLPGMLGGAFTYRKLITPLVEQGYRVVVIEALGTGSSSRPSKADYTLTTQTERLAWVMDELGVSDALIVGHALGAALGLRLACRHPGLARGVVALDGGQDSSAANSSVRRLVGLPFGTLLFTSGKIKKKVRNGLVKNSADPSWVTDTTLAGYTAPLVANPGVTLHAFQAMGRSTTTDDICPLGMAFDRPVLLLVGDAPNNSNMIPDASIAALTVVIPQLQVERLPGSGHYVQEETPDQVLTAIALLDGATATR